MKFVGKRAVAQNLLKIFSKFEVFSKFTFLAISWKFTQNLLNVCCRELAQNFLEIFWILVKKFFKICSIFAASLLEICWNFAVCSPLCSKFAWNLVRGCSKICHLLKIPHNWLEICSKFYQNCLNVWSKFFQIAWYLLGIYLKFVETLLKICSKVAWNLLKVCSKLAPLLKIG